MRMKIQVGVDDEAEFAFFLNCGADEFYAGISDIPGHLYGVPTFSNEKSFLKVVEKAHAKGKRFFAVANEVRGDIFDVTLKKAVYLVKNGADGLIVRDIALLKELKKENLKCEIILSSLALCFNCSALNFYADLGATRIAMCEQITEEEALPLIKNERKIATEVFLTASEYCVVLNSFCYLKKFTGECICRSGFNRRKEIFIMPRPSLQQHYSNLYAFYQAGAKFLKIGRHPLRNYAKIIFKQALAVRKLLEAGLDRETFVRKAMDTHFRFREFLLKWKRKK